MDAPETKAHALSVRNNVLLNAFGGGLLVVTGVAEAMVSDGDASASGVVPLSPINFLIPSTDHAVVKRVKKNPPIMTEKILST